MKTTPVLSGPLESILDEIQLKKVDLCRMKKLAQETGKITINIAQQ